MPLDRGSFLWSGHVHTEVLPFRTARGIKTMGDMFPPDPASMSFQTSVVTLSDHAGTQLDGLCHATSGDDDHWYNGFRSAEWCSDFGPRRASADQIPPIIARGVLVDVAAFRDVDALTPSHPIDADEVTAAVERQGDRAPPRRRRADSHRVAAVLGRRRTRPRPAHRSRHRRHHPRCGTVALRGERGDGDRLRHLGAGGRASGRRHVAAPVHEYLLVEQGVHMGELHFLEGLSAAGVHEFCYIALTPKVRGTTAGFALRPVAIDLTPFLPWRNRFQEE